MNEEEKANQKAHQNLKELEDKLALLAKQQEETAKTIKKLDATIKSIKEQLRGGRK
jgi:septal ring factor EnvC (AmiA/AmiB activator)